MKRRGGTASRQLTGTPGPRESRLLIESHGDFTHVADSRPSLTPRRVSHSSPSCGTPRNSLWPKGEPGDTYAKLGR